MYWQPWSWPESQSVSRPRVTSTTALCGWDRPDDRGVVLEVIAVDLPDYLLVIHAMPLAFRRT
jgi:hypothetical protein